MRRQFADHAAGGRAELLPQARADLRLPAPLHAFRLREMGLDLVSEAAIVRAQPEFVQAPIATRQRAIAPGPAAHSCRGTGYAHRCRAGYAAQANAPWSACRRACLATDYTKADSRSLLTPRISVRGWTR